MKKSPMLTGRNLEIVEKTMTKLMWNWLEQKSNYFKDDGALQWKWALIMQNLGGSCLFRD